MEVQKWTYGRSKLALRLRYGEQTEILLNEKCKDKHRLCAAEFYINDQPNLVKAFRMRRELSALRG